MTAAAESASASTNIGRKTRRWPVANLAGANLARANAAAAIEAQWIASLGDLSAYNLPPRVRQAAELRRNCPQLTYAQLADQMDITKHAYTGLIRRFRGRVQRRPLPYRQPTMAEVSLARAQALAADEARWIASLGDLSDYDFSPRVRQAAELRRDHPKASLAQLAAMMEVKPKTYSHYLNLFRHSVGWSAGAPLRAVTIQDETSADTVAVSPNAMAEAKWIAGLGDLSTYGLTKSVQRAAELRRDHPKLTQAQLAAQMGIPLARFQNLLPQFRIAATGDALRKAPLPRRLDDLNAIAQRIEESAPAPRVSPG